MCCIIDFKCSSSEQIEAGVISVSVCSCSSVFTYTTEHSGTCFGDRWWVRWQTERVLPRDPSSASAKSLSADPGGSAAAGRCFMLSNARSDLTSSERVLVYNMDELQVIVLFIPITALCQEVCTHICGGHPLIRLRFTVSAEVNLGAAHSLI